MKRLFLIVILISTVICAQAQLFVNYDGFVGIGTNSPQASLQIKKLNNDFTFKPSISGSLEIGGYDGTTNSNIIFWHSNAGFNTITAKSYSRSSDIRLKDNIEPIADPMTILKNINGYSYLYKEYPDTIGHYEYGVIAQEVKEVLPELVDSARGFMVVDYDQFIPFLIEIVKQQQKEIEQLKEMFDDNSSKHFTKSTQSVTFDSQNEQLQLFQNAPNPFNTTTIIQCYVPEEIQNAQICIYNMSGVRVLCFNILERGYVSTQVQAGSLSSGIYTYVLMGDGQISEAKQMILTR